MSEKLLPCPFCGGEARLTAAMGETWMRCIDCNAGSEMSGSHALAIAAWNRRTPAPEGEVVAWRYRQRSGAGGWAVSLEDMSDWPNLICEPLYAALRPTDTGWRDIATAPRDGTDCILWDRNHARFGSWRVDEGFASKEPMWLDDSYDDYSSGFASNPLEPTHWMPLPPAPTDTGANHD